MANYEEWNTAIAEYFISGMPRGTTIYLGVDEQVLMDIGAQFGQSEASDVDWVEDFTEAVRSECVIGNQVYLERIDNYQSDQTPRCVAFLAAMVLAAHRMVAEETEEIIIVQINYFTRLRQVLGLLHEHGGRPDGLLPAGVEESLWKIWEWWLIRNGWLPSSERGESVAYTYINYPLSQALLRAGDKEVIERLFREREKSGALSRVWDRDTVGSWVRRQQFNSKYLTELIQESDFRRYEVITDAVYNVYISIDWEQEMPETQSGVRSIVQRRLTAQLYRVEDFITGSIDYHLYPQQPRHFSGRTLEVIQDGRTHPLRKERQGWFLPLWPEDPTGGVFYEVRGNPQIKELILPERGFWILIRDPENEASGFFAGWGYPGLGETFLLLCRQEYAEQLEIFKQEDLLEWDHDFRINDEWIEYRECMIISPSWEGIIPQRQDLYDELKPTVSVTISLKGGLRVPNQSGWLEGYAPEMTVIAFDDSVELKLLDVSCPDEPIMAEIVNTNQRVSLPALDPGDYLLEAYSLGKLATQRVLLRILSWNSLDCRKAEQPFSVDVGTFTLQGAIIKVNATEDNEEG